MLKKENLDQLIQKLEAQHTKLRIFNEAYENKIEVINNYSLKFTKNVS